MVWIRIGAGVGRSSSGFWLFASLSVECKTVGNGMGDDPPLVLVWSGAVFTDNKVCHLQSRG